MDYTRLTAKDLSQDTYFRREQLWFSNLAENLSEIRAGRNVLELKGICAGPCVVVGAGPSIERFGMVEKLREASCHVIACDKALIPLLRAGVVPEFVLSIDGDPKIAEFYNDPLVRRQEKLKGIFNVQVSPEVIRAFPGEKYWFTVLMDNPVADIMSISRAVYWMTKEKTMAQSYGNVGGFAWAFAEMAGHQTIILAGIDLSYGDGVQPMQTPYWKYFLDRRKGITKDALKLDYSWVNNPFGHRVLVDPIWRGYAEVLSHGVSVSSAKTVQSSPLTSFFGPGIHCMPLEDALKKYVLQLRAVR